MVNGVITKKEWDEAEKLDDLLLDFRLSEEGKMLFKKWCESKKDEDYKKLQDAKYNYLRQHGYMISN